MVDGSPSRLPPPVCPSVSHVPCPTCRLLNDIDGTDGIDGIDGADGASKARTGRRRSAELHAMEEQLKDLQVKSARVE